MNDCIIVIAYIFNSFCKKHIAFKKEHALILDIKWQLKMLS